MAEAFSARVQSTFEPFVPKFHWVLRLALASIFIYHGMEKLRGGTPPAEMLDMMFFGSAGLFWLVAVGEVVAGVAILAGGFKFNNADLVTRFAGATIFVIMAGAALTVHLPTWHFMQGGAEFQVLTAALGLWFVVRGNA